MNAKDISEKLVRNQLSKKNASKSADIIAFAKYPT